MIAGCCTGEFDSTYPVQLNGIISQYEFQESINKINQAFSYMKSWLSTIIIVFIVVMIVSVAAFVIGGVIANKSWPAFYSLLAIGIFISVFGSIMFSVLIFVIVTKRTARVREIIAQESLKYSSRSPTPCSWRLNTFRYWYGNSGYNNNNVFYQVRTCFSHFLKLP